MTAVFDEPDTTVAASGDESGFVNDVEVTSNAGESRFERHVRPTSKFLDVEFAQIARYLAPVTSAAVAPSQDSTDELRARFAFAIFSVLLEPGDTDATWLIAALGPVDAVTAIIQSWPVDRILSAVGSDDVVTAQFLVDRLPGALERWRPRVSLRTTVASLESAGRIGATLVTPIDPLWPPGFNALGEGAPACIWVRGDPGRLAELDRSIALVGARAATGYGEHVASESAAGLADRGFAVVSGGAYGIDGAAHRAAVASGQTTIAFLAGGVDRLYPSGHSELLTRIAASGLLIGELPCGSAPTKWRFLQRNRLIAAASRATVVIEAGRRSGSLNTAGHAASIGRPLGAVPGPVTSPASAGCHRLIREYDAVCVTSVAEMAELVDGPVCSDSGQSPDSSRRSPDHVRVLDALSARSARSVVDIAARAGLSIEGTTAALGVLELEGAVSEREQGWVTAPQR